MCRKISSFSEPFEEAVFNGLGTFLKDISQRSAEQINMHLQMVCRNSPEKKRLVLAALSGGADSSAMTAALAAIREKIPQFEISALHVNHGIRAKELCIVDEEAAIALCKKLAIPIIITRIPSGEVAAFARQYGVGIEGAARHFRYQALGEEAQRLGANVIVTAHTADDRLETILMAFLRGSGPAGLGALSDNNAAFKVGGAFGVGAAFGADAGSGNHVSVLRPLVSQSREEVLAYLKERNLGFCIDETNNDERFFRNKIRRVLIPFLDQQFPGWRVPVLRLGETQAITAEFLAEEAENQLPWKDFSLSANHFFSAPEILREEALFLALNRLKPNTGFAENYYQEKKPRRDTLRSFIRGNFTAADLGNARLECKNGRIIVKKIAEQADAHGFSVLIKRAGVYKLNGITVIAGGQQTGLDKSIFYADFPLVFYSVGDGKILAEGLYGRAAVIRKDGSVWERGNAPAGKNICFAIIFNGGSFTDGS